MSKSIVDKAYEFADLKHKDQKDDNGKEYFGAHILNVVSILMQVTKDPVIIAAGYLHDTLEDTDTTMVEIEMQFGNEIASLVRELTHEGTNDNVGYYFPRLASKKAIIIKFADRLSNLSRMDNWTPKRQQHYLSKSKFWKSQIQLDFGMDK